MNQHGVVLNDPDGLLEALDADQVRECYFYTSHQIYYEDGLIRQTRSSPNWEGGMVTYCTCKHLMRSVSRDTWEDTWIATVGPRECENNCLVCVGRIWRSFPSNFTLSGCLRSYPEIFKVKMADTNPRGDLYTPKGRALAGYDVYKHSNFLEPPKHTRSVDFYKKSPGSVSERKDGLIPKWWRDLEYTMYGNRPMVFILSPCWIFSRPMLWSDRDPKRACLRMTAHELGRTLVS